MQKNLNKKYKLFLFDLDGTLLDTAREFHLALNEVLKRESKPSQNFEKVRERVSDGAGALVTLGFNIDQKSIYFEEKRNFSVLDHGQNRVVEYSTGPEISV